MPEQTKRRTDYGWKLATFRLPSDTYSFEVLSQKDGDETIELELKITGGMSAGATYNGHRVRAFIPKEDKFYETKFRALLESEYGLIVPATVQKF